MIRLLRWVRRNVDLVVELAAYAMWLLIDAVISHTTGTYLPVLAGLVIPGIVLLRRRPGTDLVVVAVLAVATSLAISVLTVTTAVTLLGPAASPYYLSFAESPYCAGASCAQRCCSRRPPRWRSSGPR